MNDKLIEILRKYSVFEEKELVLDFLKYENRFYELLSLDNKDFNENLICELKLIGKYLNLLKNHFNTNNEYGNVKEFFYSLGILSILNMDYIPEEFHPFIARQEFNNISGNSTQKIFNQLYDKYNLINNVYVANGKLGLTKYIFINRDFLKTKNKTLYYFSHIKLLSTNDIINLTSSETPLNRYKMHGISEMIMKTKLIEKEKLFKKDMSDTIYL